MQRKTADAPARIWVELEYPVDDADGNAQAGKLDRWLKACGLGFRNGALENVWWNERKQRYCFTTDEAGGYVEAGDHGHWYLLDGLIELAEKRA